MKKFRAIAMTLAVLTVLSSFTGCNVKKLTDNGSGTSDGKMKITKQPLELTIHMHYWNRIVFKDEWPTFKKAAELTNISLKGTASKTATDSEQVFNIMMASGKLPDIIHGRLKSLDTYGRDGALIPLNDLIEKEAPNIKKLFEDMPEVKKACMSEDGKIYYIPYVYDARASAAMGYFIRQDWLDKLGLKTPKTVNEFYTVLKAFRENDPNGNGKKDEVPYFGRAAAIPSLLQALGSRKEWYVKDGKVYNGRYEPEYKAAIETIAQWYKEGLIDKEIYTRGNNARDVLLGDNLGGAIHDWFGSTSSYNESLKDKVPGFKLAPILPLADQNGRIIEEYRRPLLEDGAWGISSSNKSPVETIRYFDFWLSDVGRRLLNFGIDGQHYTMVDGKPKFTDDMLHSKDGTPMPDMLYNNGASIIIGSVSDYDSESQFTNPIASKAMIEYKQYLTEDFPNLKFTVAEQKIIDTKSNAINTYIKEKEQNWVLGVEPVSVGYDNYINSLKNMGMDEVIAIYNTAYQRYIKK